MNEFLITFKVLLSKRILQSILLLHFPNQSLLPLKAKSTMKVVFL